MLQVQRVSSRKASGITSRPSQDWRLAGAGRVLPAPSRSHPARLPPQNGGRQKKQIRELALTTQGLRKVAAMPVGQVPSGTNR